MCNEGDQIWSTFFWPESSQNRVRQGSRGSVGELLLSLLEIVTERGIKRSEIVVQDDNAIIPRAVALEADVGFLDVSVIVYEVVVLEIRFVESHFTAAAIVGDLELTHRFGHSLLETIS